MLADSILSDCAEPAGAAKEGRDSPQQYLRVRYFLSGVLILIFGWGLGLYAEWHGLGISGGPMKVVLGVLAFQGVLAVMFFTGFNLRFADKALTVVQAGGYVMFVSAMVLAAAPLRHIILVWYGIALSLTLPTIRFGESVLVSVIALCSYLVAIAFLARWGEISFYLPVEVFAVATLTAYLVVYCAAARYLQIRRRIYKERRQSVPRAPVLDFKLKGGVRELGVNEFSSGLRHLRQHARNSGIALTEISFLDARLIMAEHGRDALRALERHLVGRLREWLQGGALLCVAGEGRILALYPAASPVDALSQAQGFCREESETVVVLPGIAKPIAIQCSCKCEGIE